MLSKFKNTVFGDRSLSKDPVSRWLRQFMSGARTMEGDDRYGYISTTVTPENVPRVETHIPPHPPPPLPHTPPSSPLLHTSSLFSPSFRCSLLHYRTAHVWQHLKLSERPSLKYTLLPARSASKDTNRFSLLS